MCRMKKYEKPYFLSFNHVIFVAGQLLLDLDKRERLAAIFDESKEYQGRAKELWDDLKRQPVTKLVPVAPRMGTLTHADSKQYAGLQAADILAHEARRYFMEVSFNTFPNEERWQWTALNASHHIDVYPIGRQALKLLYRLDDFL